MLRRTPNGRFLRLSAPQGTEECSCAWPLPLPWRRFRPGAIWECGRCRQQWEWRAARDGRGWQRLPRQAWLANAAAGDGSPPPAAWSSVFYGGDREKV